MRIRREESQDVQQVRAVNLAAFGSDAEARMVDLYQGREDVEVPSRGDLVPVIISIELTFTLR